MMENKKTNREKNIQDIKIKYYELGKMIDDKEIKYLSDEEIRELRKTIGGARDYLFFNHI